ncbi:hypothetical protein [Streptomyces specialis]|uniref:hypothetical protein n=1 Tax=Streptomyces specialis TaxID=498367 RepID=UPI00073F9801|nr:hypothetical protein [Streptomyces specialis]
MALNPWEVDDVFQAIAMLFRPLMRLWFPAEGWRHAPGGFRLVGEKQRVQRARRRALWLATVRIDNGPRWIHGVRVTAR